MSTRAAEQPVANHGMIVRRPQATSQLARRQACDADPSCMTKEEFLSIRNGELPVRLSTLKSIDREVTFLPSLSVFNDAAQVQPVILPALLSGGTLIAPFGFNNRVSSRIRLVGLRFRVNFFPYEGIATPLWSDDVAPCCARVIVVYDRAPGVNATTFGTVFSAFQTNGTQYDDPFCMQNPVNTDRFFVLHDESVPLPGLFLTAPPGAGNPWQFIASGDTMNLAMDRYVDLTGLISRFTDLNDGSGLVGSCNEGLVSVIIISDSLIPGAWNALLNARGYFYD